MRNAKKQRESQRQSARELTADPGAAQRAALARVKVDLGAEGLFERATAKQRQLGYPRLSEFVRAAVIDFLVRHGDAGAVAQPDHDNQPEVAALRG